MSPRLSPNCRQSSRVSPALNSRNCSNRCLRFGNRWAQHLWKKRSRAYRRAMRLLEAIVDANHRAGLHPADFADVLPLVALTCIDVRLNTLLPQVLGVPPEQFIWLRNAGNIITGPSSSTMRSLALACAVKGGKEIVIIGHTDCQVCKTSTMQLLDRLKALGVERHMLPDNLTEFFGMFG